MNKRISTRALTEGAIISAITALLGVLSYYIPFLTLLVYIWPIPIIILGKRQGVTVSIMATFSAGVLVSLFTPILFSMQIVIMYGLLGIALGYAYEKEMKITKAIFLGYVTSFLSTVILLQFYSVITGVSIVTEFAQMMKVTIEESTLLYQGMGIDENIINESIGQMRGVIDTISQLFPAILLMIPMAVTLVNMWVAEKILKKLGFQVIEIPPFRKWKLPRHASYGLFAIVLIAGLGQYFTIPNFEMVYQNLLYLILILFFIQGLAVVAHVFYYKKVSRLIRMLGFVLIFIMPLLQMTVQFIGLFDTAFNFRDKFKFEQD